MWLVGCLSRQIREVKELFGDVAPSDLVTVNWCDVSTGKIGMRGVATDAPVCSWGVLLNDAYSQCAFKVVHLVILCSWKSEILVTIAGLTETIVDLFVGKKA